MNILCVDDDKDYLSLISELLRQEGYVVSTALSAADGLEIFKKKHFDLVISDLKMSGVDGVQFFILLRKIEATIKVMILTGADDPNSEIRSLGLYIDDYIKKPIDFDVLLKRVELVLERKYDKTNNSELKSEEEKLRVDLKRRRVYKDNVEVSLTALEYDLLLHFLQNKNTVLTRKEILQKIWDMDESLFDVRNIDTHVKNLRAKLELASIYSVRGVGYEWCE